MRERNDLLSGITVDSAIMFGNPTIRKMRITVDGILPAFAGEVSERKLLEVYP